MRALMVDVRDASGRILNTTVFRPGGKKLLARGHVISEDDVRLLETEGLRRIPIAEIEDGEVAEDDAVLQVARELGIGSCEIRLAAGGRANLVATEACCVLVDEDLLKQINCASSVVIATIHNFACARPGERIATVKSAPFAVTTEHLEAVIDVLRQRGAVLQARPIRDPILAVVYTDPLQPERCKELFAPIMQQRLERFGISAKIAITAIEEEKSLTRALQHVLRCKPTVVLFASTTAPAGPSDPIGLSMQNLGCSIERYLAPVEPGNLLLLGYKDDTPVVSAPGCFRSAKPNVVDLILPPMLARYRVSGWEVAALGHGGLLA